MLQIDWELMLGWTRCSFHFGLLFSIDRIKSDSSLFDILFYILNDPVVEIWSTQVIVTICSKNLQVSLWFYLQDAHIERASTQVEDKNLFLGLLTLFLLLYSPFDGCRSGLTQNVYAI